MPRRRHVLRALALLVALALIGPASALAQSAGNQQYVDPLSSTTPASSGSAPAPSSSTSQAPAAPAATSASAPASSAPTASTSSTSSSAPPTSTTSGAAASGHATLPFTGLDLWPTVAVAFGLIGSGLTIRRVARRA